MNQIKRFVHSPLWIYIAVRLLAEPVEKVSNNELKEYEKAYTYALAAIRKEGRSPLESWMIRKVSGWFENELAAIRTLKNADVTIVADKPSNHGTILI